MLLIILLIFIVLFFGGGFVTPAPLSLLADDFRASFAAIHGALDGIDGLEFGVNVTDGCTVRVAPKFTAQLRGRCLAYWRTVYDQQAVAA